MVSTHDHHVLFCHDPLSHLAIDSSSCMKLTHTRTDSSWFDTTLRNKGCCKSWNVLADESLRKICHYQQNVPSQALSRIDRSPFCPVKTSSQLLNMVHVNFQHSNSKEMYDVLIISQKLTIRKIIELAEIICFRPRGFTSTSWGGCKVWLYWYAFII